MAGINYASSHWTFQLSPLLDCLLEDYELTITVMHFIVKDLLVGVNFCCVYSKIQRNVWSTRYASDFRMVRLVQQRIISSSLILGGEGKETRFTTLYMNP